MTSYPEQFIEKYIDLIDNNNFKEFYKLVNTNVKVTVTQSQGEITSILLDAGINPLEYLDQVPECYLQSNKFFSAINIPYHIKTIEPYAFAMSSIENVYLHEGILEIRANAFLKCDKLKILTLPKSLNAISKNAFDATEIRFKVYEGSYAQQWCEDNMYSWELIKI